MPKIELKQRAEDLHRRAKELRSAGALAQMTKGPDLVEDTGAFLVELATRLDALTPYQDEGAAA
jgi:hypothetical protein